MKFNYRLMATASCFSLCMGASGLAQAQTVRSVDELVVTAQKREQNLQDVPIVVTALPAKLLQDAGVKDIRDLTILTAGLTVNAGSSEGKTTARIRGIGTLGENSGLESAVGVVIDGVYRARTGAAFGDLGELERVEVLKGPQGTLFGKSTSAGVINVITKSPSFNFGADGELTFSNFNGRGGSASVTGPLSGDTVAGRLYVAARKQDGFNDVFDGKGPSTITQDADRDFWTARGQLLIDPNDSASIRIIADYTKRDEHCCGVVQIHNGPSAAIVNSLAAPFPGLATPPDPFGRLEYQNRPSSQVITDQGLGAEAKFKLPIGDLTSVTGLRRWNGTAGTDVDFTTADIVYRDNRQFSKIDTFSQEFRLTGTTGALDWLVGAIYSNEKVDAGANLLAGADFEKYFSLLLSGTNSGFVGILLGRPAGTSYPAGSGEADDYVQHDTTAALFTNNTWHATDKIDVTLGLRYTADRKKLDTMQTLAGGSVGCAAAKQRFAAGAWSALGLPAAAQQAILNNLCLVYFNNAFDGRTISQKHDENEWSGTLKAAYRWTPELMTYASYARGYKAGGFNFDRRTSVDGTTGGLPGIVPVADTSFPAETADSYELGVKSTLFGRSLLLNATAFYEKFTDFQLNAFVSASFVVRSMPEVTSKGVDADVVWYAPLDGLSFQGGVTYADTQYGNQPAPNDPANALVLLPGAQVSFAPLWSLSGSATYETKISDSLTARFNIGAKYLSSFRAGDSLLPPEEQKGYTLVNARAVLAGDRDRWAVEIWAQNLFDTKYNSIIATGPLQGSSGIDATHPVYDPARDTVTYVSFLGLPRTYGVTLRTHF
ncbi:MAG TPA: TonB-dependent receptor [Phenylobacterium sp.]|jgi:outer membrane receptor protein involved in Fe transport